MAVLPSNTKYFEEAYNLFQQCSQNEDLKVFDEASSSTSDTVKIAKACSRELEKLLPFVSSRSILPAKRIPSNRCNISVFIQMPHLHQYEQFVFQDEFYIKQHHFQRM